MSRLTYLAIGSRLLLGLLWLSAATFKALDFGGFNEIIRQQYQLPQLVSYAAAFLPALETFLGLCLLLEFRVRQALLGSITLLLTFCLVIAYGLVAGNLESCGCLGSFDDISPSWAIIRNIGLSIMAICALRFEPGNHDNAAWKGWALAIACTVSALATGSSIEQPHFHQSKLVYGEPMPALGIDLPELKQGPVALFLFRAGCSKCWDAAAQVQTLVAEPRLKVIGITPSPADELNVFKEALKPEFPIYSISQEIYDKLDSKIPTLYMLHDGILLAHLEGRVPTLTSVKHFTEQWFEAFLVGKPHN